MLTFHVYDSLNVLAFQTKLCFLRVDVILLHHTHTLHSRCLSGWYEKEKLARQDTYQKESGNSRVSSTGVCLL